VLTVLGVGTVILLPSFVYLFRIFKGQGTAFKQLDGYTLAPLLPFPGLATFSLCVQT
jgi:hypothetical protein